MLAGMNEPQMAALLVAHGRPGFYFRVLEEGEVATGDEIMRVASGPERMSVFEINALLYLPGHSSSQLERALRVPAIGDRFRIGGAVFEVTQPRVTCYRVGMRVADRR
jgi:MOSC domain-containing protein YiiM